MGGTILSKTVKETDLGVTMNPIMKVSEQCRIAAPRGNQVGPYVLGMIRRNITYKENSLIVPWRATKLNPGQRDLKYERLNECGLTTLETRN